MLPANIAFALGAAVTWGAGDFAGGMSVKRAGGSLRSALRIVLVVHLSSLLALLVAIGLRHDPLPSPAATAWGLGAGLAAGICVIAFYICLARGAMGSSAAISGLLAAAIPAVVAVGLEGKPGATSLVGFLLTAIAIWLIAAGPQTQHNSRGILFLAMIAGAGFGLYFVALRMAGSAGVLWPLALSRCTSALVAAIGLVAMRLRRDQPTAGQEQGWLPRSSLGWAGATAVFDTGGNLFYIAAVRSGRLDIGAVLASLYPAMTILLAAWVLRERPTVRQGVGMGLAVAAVILITLAHQ